MEKSPQKVKATVKEADWPRIYNWWWRGRFVDPVGKVWPSHTGKSPSQLPAGPAFKLRNDQLERSAWLYEIAKRVEGKYELGKPWCDLNSDEKWMLKERWPNEAQTILAWHLTDGATPPPDAEKLPQFWNLRMNDSVLVKTFVKAIQEARRRRGIPKPAPNEGQSRRPRSWRPIEYKDVHDHGLRSLDEAQRSQMSSAIKLYERIVRA